MAGEDSGKRAQFGNRFLTDPANVFEHNAWDNVAWDEEQEREARRVVEANSATLVDPDLLLRYERDSDRYWDSFYVQHQNKFFKDRHWLFTEFPELAPPPPPPPLCATQTSPTIENPLTQSSATRTDSSPRAIHSTTLTQASASEHFDLVTASEQQPGVGWEDASGTETREATGKAGVQSNGDVEEAEGVLQGTGEGGRCSDIQKSESFPGKEARVRMFEVGCGVGNTVFPVLQTNNDPGLFVYCCDLSPNAIQLVREHPDYDDRRCHAFVCDVTDPTATLPFPTGSLDVIILIFVLSAINPAKLPGLAARLASLLKPGGLIVLRDYGRYDLTQLRFKTGRCLGENFYARGDGTKVYFSTQEELQALFTGVGLREEQNLVDRRLQVNRGRQVKMYRVWIQCKFRKPCPAAADSATLDLATASHASSAHASGHS